jgi:hypothetical protein
LSVCISLTLKIEIMKNLFIFAIITVAFSFVGCSHPFLPPDGPIPTGEDFFQEVFIGQGSSAGGNAGIREVFLLQEGPNGTAQWIPYSLVIGTACQGQVFYYTDESHRANVSMTAGHSAQRVLVNWQTFYRGRSVASAIQLPVFLNSEIIGQCSCWDIASCVFTGGFLSETPDSDEPLHDTPPPPTK